MAGLVEPCAVKHALTKPYPLVGLEDASMILLLVVRSVLSRN